MHLGEEQPGSDICGYNVEECTRKATRHFMLPNHQYISACALHEAIARKIGEPVDEHPFECDCNMPGTIWVYTQDGKPGRCIWDGDNDVEIEVYDELLVGFGV